MRAQSLPAVRFHGALPRRMFLIAAAVLALLGGKTLMAPTPGVRPADHAAVPASDVRVAGFAESFARAYLTIDPRQPDRRARALESYGLREDETQARLKLIAEWVAARDVRRLGGRQQVTVEAQTDDGTIYLAVFVTDQRGQLKVLDAPAIVGAPRTAPPGRPPTEYEAGVPALQTVVTRALRHYVRGDATDLAADMAGAIPPVPDNGFTAIEIEPITWVRRGRTVAARALITSPKGLRFAARYELAVVRRAGRWLVVDINHTKGRS